jgi:hypothetical protein
MEDVFNRRYSLTIGRSAQLIQRTIPASIIKPGGVESTPSPAGAGFTLADGSYKDFLVKPGGAITLSELRVTASVEYTKEGKTNKQTTVITIFNLSQTNQQFIRSEDTVLFRAGYDKDGETPPLVFVGQIKSVTTEKKGQDTITKLLCTDAEIPRKNVRISRPPTRDETSETIAQWFADIAAKNGIPTGNVFVPIAIPYPSGLPLAGPLFPLMEDFCDRNNLKAYVTLGRLYIEPIDSIPVSEKVDIEAINIKGSIRKEDDSTSKSSLDSDKRSGIIFNVFLNGNITLATVVNIKFGDYRGEYDISSLKVKLDLEGKDWDTIVSCKRR